MWDFEGNDVNSEDKEEKGLCFGIAELYIDPLFENSLVAITQRDILIGALILLIEKYR